MRVLHVTEAMGGGIVTLTDSISSHQSDCGSSVEVWYIERSDTPSVKTLERRFDPRVMLVSFGPKRNLMVLFRRIRKCYRSDEFDVVHLHSSIAGLVGRVALFGIRTRVAVYYSPHGFAFLRSNKNRFTRTVTLFVERALSRTGSGLILTSQSERTVAIDQLDSKRNHLLQTGVPSGSIRVTKNRPQGIERKLVVGTVGRVSFQKAPWRFAAVADALASEAQFVWVGDGPRADISRWIGSSPVKITGWVDSDKLTDLIDSFDIFLFPSLWEGMALSLAQAQAQGVPAITSDAVGNVDTVRHGFSGFVCTNDEEIVTATRKLIQDGALRETMSRNAIVWAFETLTDDRIGQQSLAIYESTFLEKSASRGIDES